MLIGIQVPITYICDYQVLRVKVKTFKRKYKFLIEKCRRNYKLIKCFYF